MVTEILPECPTCHAKGKRCKRPSGHEAAEWHAARRALMVAQVLHNEGPVVPLQGLSSDPERRALDATDAEADARMAEEVGQDAADGERCEPCKGFGLVRGVGKNAGGRYKTLAGAHAAQDAGRAVDCPSCGGLGLVGLKVDEESADSETVPV